MSLANRLRQMEQRIADLEERCAELEQFNAHLVVAIADDAAAGEQETVTLDGERVGGTRDQTASLG